MSSRDDLQVWAPTIDIDPVTSTPQREPILADIWQYGWLRETPVTAQDINQLMYIVTDVVKNDTLSKALNLSDVVDKAAARTNLDLLQKSQNLADVPNKPAARANLGIDTAFDTFFDNIYPVGTIYENKTNPANPSTYFGRGTWLSEGAGRVQIGAGTGTDINGTPQTFTAGSIGGEYTHELTVSEMPSHSHPVNWQLYNESPLVTEGNLASGSNNAVSEPTFVDSTGSTGGGTKHNNIQPYTVVYRWVRTA